MDDVTHFIGWNKITSNKETQESKLMLLNISTAKEYSWGRKLASIILPEKGGKMFKISSCWSSGYFMNVL